MTKQLARKQKIDRLICKWKKKLNLREWDFKVVFINEYKNDAISVVAECHVNVEYLFAKIVIFKAYWENTIKEQERTIVHELCHCISEPAYDAHLEMCNYKIVTRVNIESIREQLTQRITNIAFPHATNNK